MYIVRSFVDGHPAAELGEREVTALLDLNRRQAGLQPTTERDWSSYVHRVVFDDGEGFAPLARTHPDTARLMRRIGSATAGLRAEALPTTDVVHGDFTIENALFRDGVAHVIDAEFAGSGTRAYDLATLLVDSALPVNPSDPRILERLRDECLDLVGPHGLLLCASARIVGLAAWGFDHWPADLQSFAGRCDRLLDSLGA
jgi:hypothetical protein